MDSRIVGMARMFADRRRRFSQLSRDPGAAIATAVLLVEVLFFFSSGHTFIHTYTQIPARIPPNGLRNRGALHPVHTRLKRRFVAKWRLFTPGPWLFNFNLHAADETSGFAGLFFVFRVHCCGLSGGSLSASMLASCDKVRDERGVNLSPIKGGSKC